MLHIQSLITFTYDPPSTIVPGSSRPLIIVVIAELLVSTTAGPSSGLEKKARADAEFCGANVDFKPLVNRGTNCSKRTSGSIIWQSCSAYHVGFSCVVSIGSSEGFIYSRNSFICLLYPFCGLFPDCFLSLPFGHFLSIGW